MYKDVWDLFHLSGVLYSTKENPQPDGRSLLGFKASILALVDIIYKHFIAVMMYGNYVPSWYPATVAHWGLCKYNSILPFPGQPWVNCFSIWGSELVGRKLIQKLNYNLGKNIKSVGKFVKNVTCNTNYCQVFIKVPV